MKIVVTMAKAMSLVVFPVVFVSAPYWGHAAKLHDPWLPLLVLLVAAIPFGIVCMAISERTIQGRDKEGE